MDRLPAPMTADYSAALRTHQVWVAEDGDRVLGMLVLVPEGDVMPLENVAVRGPSRRPRPGSRVRPAGAGRPGVG
ncbi:hypothetical protein [Saccharopolyspora hattusasensis]|uniref:hypothetical protein n=1 Tax=Saccharopolyspora hattusasensis TaxID=1128679 RepID=UPI003D978512